MDEKPFVIHQGSNEAAALAAFDKIATIIRKKEKTPKCPCCGAKFSHHTAMAVCRKCGIPDEMLRNEHTIAAWRKKMRRATRPSQSGITKRKKKKHGRR